MDLLKSLQALLGADSSARTNKHSSKEETLHYQGSDLYKQNIKLREQLDEAHDRIVQLENKIFSMKEESTKVEMNLDSKRKEIDRITVGLTAQIREMSDSLEERLKQLEGKVAGQFSRMGTDSKEQLGELKEIRNAVKQMEENTAVEEQIRELYDSVQKIADIREMIEKLDAQQAAVVAINEAAEDLKSEIADKIHAENVKCYRNMKSLVSDLEVKLEQMELGEESLKKIRSSFKGLKFFAFFALADFVVIVLYILHMTGVI